MTHTRIRYLFLAEILFSVILLTGINIAAARINYGMEGDEVFSYISATSEGGFKGVCYLADRQWYDADYFRNAVIADGSERFNVKMVIENQAMDTHPPLYYLFLNLVCSVFGGHFSKWFGIGLNIFFMLFTALGLYLVLQYFIRNRPLSLALCTIFGCSFLSVSMVLFIRMYVLMMALVLLQVRYHLYLYDKLTATEDMTYRKNLWTYAVLILFTLAGSLTHYYFILCQGLLSATLVIFLAFRRQNKNILRYGMTMAASAVIYICLYPAVLNHLFFKYRGRDAVHKFLKESGLFKEAFSMLASLNDKLFKGCLPAIVIALLLATIAAVILCRVNPLAILRDPLILAVPSLIYFYGISKASPFITIRYVSPVVALLYAAIIIWAKRLIDIAAAHLPPPLGICRICAETLMCVCLFFTTVYFFDTPVKEPYFAEKQAVIDRLSADADYCVYVGDGVNYWRMWEDYMNYPAFDGLFFINGCDRLPIDDPRLLAQKNIVIFIDRALDTEETISYLQRYLPFREYDLQYETGYTEILSARIL